MSVGRVIENQNLRHDALLDVFVRGVVDPPYGRRSIIDALLRNAGSFVSARSIDGALN